MIHRADDAYRFLHESAIAQHHGLLIAAWNNSPSAESEAGTVVRWTCSADGGAHWSEPAPLAPPLQHPSTIWESCQLLSAGDRLWAFVGQVHAQPRRPEASGGRMVVFVMDEATRRWRAEGEVEGLHPLNRPQRTPEGRWAIGGQYNLVLPRVALSYGDDLTRWDVVDIPSAPEDQINFAETALAVGEGLLTAYVRSSLPAVYRAESRDGGRTWTPIQASNLPASSSKLAAGSFSTGQRYLAFNMRPEAPEAGARDALALAVSAPGETLLRKIVLLRNGRSPNPRVAGFAKAPQWSYPSVLEHEGQIYVTYSVTKEDCGLSILPLGECAVR